MYTIDERDRVVELDGLPKQNTGAPHPHVLATDHELLLWYLIGPNAEEIALVRFILSHAHYFGSPNDEALHGHPLHSRGLEWYGTYEVIESSWIRSLERMNRVHDRHQPRHFDELRHFVFTFHDDTFECVAAGLEFTRLSGESISPASVLPRAAIDLSWTKA